MTSWKDWKYCSCMRPCFVYCLKPCFSSFRDEYGFKDCKHLDFSHCNLKEVPDEIFSLERTLEELLLDVNSIRDLPRVVFHCTGLKKLSISDNEIETLPNAISSLIYLEYLNISRNSLLVIPDGIKCCKCLTVLDCSVNPLGKVPDSLTQLINLQELYLNDTFLEYLPANFGRLSRLRIVELRENNLKILPKSFQRLINLERLDIGQNELVEFPEVLCNLINLQELWIDGNRIPSIPEMAGNLTKLTYLDASENRIVTVAARIAACEKLTDLLLSGNKIIELPESLGSLKHLTYLRLDDNKLTCLPQSIGGLSSLQELVISNNVIQSLPKNIGFLRNLHSLIMDCNQLKEIPDTICSCTKLRLLSIATNELVELPEDIGRLSNLRVLNLRNNLLKYLPYSFANINNLQTLWLSDNQQKPIMKLQTDTDEMSQKKVLTCFLLPQQSSSSFPCDEAYLSDHDDQTSSSRSEMKSSNTESRIKFYSANGEIDDKDEQFISKLVRNPTPYPKELKAHARHARNLALKRRDSFGNEVDDDYRSRDSATMLQQSVEPSVNKGSEKTSQTEIKEAKLTRSVNKSERESLSNYSTSNYDNQQFSQNVNLKSREEKRRTILLNQQQPDSPVTANDHESKPSNMTFPDARITGSPMSAQSNEMIDDGNNFHKPFPLPANECYSMVIDQQNRPMAIYNNNNLLTSSSQSPSANYQINQETSSRSNHPSPSPSLSSSSSTYNQHHFLQSKQASLERQLLMRTTATYSIHPEQFTPHESSPTNPLIGFNDSNRSAIKSLSSLGNINVNSSGYGVSSLIGGTIGDNYGPQLSNFKGTSNKILFHSNPPQPPSYQQQQKYHRQNTHQITVDPSNQNSIILSDEAKLNHYHQNYSMTISPSTSQQQSTRQLFPNDAISNNQQLTKKIPPSVSNITSLSSDNHKLVDKLTFPTATATTSSPSSASVINNKPTNRYTNNPSQTIYKHFSMHPNQSSIDFVTQTQHQQQQYPPSTSISSTPPKQLNQLGHVYNQHQSFMYDQDKLIIGKSPDALLTATTSSSGGS